MIQTIQYNDFSKIDYNLRNDFPKVLDIFREFVKNGGNLDIAVSPSSGQIIPFEEWMQKNFPSNPEYFIQLIDEKLITNPFNFIVDHENKVIKDIPNYGLYWMSRNHDKYSSYIYQAVSNLAKEIKDWPIKNNNKYIYYNYDYNGSILTSDRNHPLKEILKSLTEKEFKAIFEVDPTYATLWEKEKIAQLCDIRWGRIKNTELTYNFFNTEHGKKSILEYDFESTEEKNCSLHDLISYAISINDIKFVDTHFTSKEIQEIEKSKTSTETFIKDAKSSEMTTLLINKGAFIFGKFNDEKEATSCIDSSIKFETLKTLLESNKELADSIKTNSEHYYNTFFNTRNHHTYYHNKDIFDIAKLLIEKYDFPLSNYEVLPFISGLANQNKLHKETFEWFINHGMNPLHCKGFVSACLSQRTDGLKELKLLQKQNYFNSFYPDPIYYLLNEYPTKEFTKFLEKAPDEMFTRTTVKGYLAWWGATNTNTFDLVKSKVNDFTQNSSNGFSLFYYMSREPKKSSYDKFNLSSFILLMENHLKKNPNTFDISGSDSLGKNAFHYLLEYNEYRSKELSPELTALFLNNIDNRSNISKLLSSKDNEGNTPLTLMLKTYEKLSSNSYVATTLKTIIETAINHTPMDFLWEEDVGYINEVMDKNGFIVGKKVNTYETLLFICDSNKVLKEKVEKSYNTWKLFHKLNNNLSSEKTIKKSAKI